MPCKARSFTWVHYSLIHNHFFASSPIFFQIFSPKTLTALPLVLSNAGRNHGRGLVNLLRNIHPPQEVLEARVRIEMDSRCNCFLSLSNKLRTPHISGNRKQNHKCSRNQYPGSFIVQ